MSSLTKVFVLVVSALAIFLCGLVVTYVSTAENYKAAFDDERVIRQAAQAQAVAAEQARSQEKERYEALIGRLNATIVDLQGNVADLARELVAQRQMQTEAVSRANTAVNASAALQQTVQNMYEGQNAVQAALDKAQRAMIVAQAQVIDLTRALEEEKVKSNQLESMRREAEEKMPKLEDENFEIRRRLEQVTVSSSEMRAGMDRVSLSLPQLSGVPISGEVTAVEKELATISVGSSSGVRPNMTFHVSRGEQYLGDFVVIDVEPSAAAGRLAGRQGVIVAGDRVSTGF